MNLEANNQLNYVCINCGNEVKELYKKYSSSVLKIMSCEKCKQTADKYIEYEPVIILIDLVLLSQPAVRHILYNTQFRIYSKILVVQLLFESYIIWKDVPRTVNNDEYAAEKEFYFFFVITIIDNVLLFLIFRQLTKFVNSTIHLVKAMTLANIAKFFMIPIVIWGNNGTDLASLRLVLVHVYYYFSLVNVYAVLMKCSRKYSCTMILLTIVIKYIVMVEVTERLKSFLLI